MRNDHDLIRLLTAALADPSDSETLGRLASVLRRRGHMGVARFVDITDPHLTATVVQAALRTRLNVPGSSSREYTFSALTTRKSKRLHIAVRWDHVRRDGSFVPRTDQLCGVVFLGNERSVRTADVGKANDTYCATCMANNRYGWADLLNEVARAYT